MKGDLPPLREPRNAAVQTVLTATWVGVIPALLAGLVIRYLVPPPGSGLPGMVTTLGHDYGLYFAVALYFMFSALARHWRFRVPGGRYASHLPAQLVPEETDAQRLAQWAGLAQTYEHLRGPGVRDAALTAPLRELYDGLRAGDLRRTDTARHAVESAAAPLLHRLRMREQIGFVLAVAVAAGGTLALRAWVTKPYRVLSASMLPTLEPGDHIAGNALAYGAAPGGRLPRRGDVIVFQSSAVALGRGNAGVPDQLVKRVIGLPGDRIEMHGNLPIINGWEVPTCDAGEYIYLMPDSSGGALHGRLRVEFLEDRAYLTLHTMPMPFAGAYVVKPGEVFVLGDNRSNSLDSRAFDAGKGGGVPAPAVEAQARWFLVGTHRGGDADWGRLFRPLDRLEVGLRLEGVETDSLQAGIARCLKNRPPSTRPPASLSSIASREAGAR